jgi:hypothetical protein
MPALELEVFQSFLELFDVANIASTFLVVV